MAERRSPSARKAFFTRRLPLYRKDPELFAREVCRFEPDRWQKEALADIAAYPRVAIKSGQGVGKTSLESIVLLWFLSCFPYARIVATAPTYHQLNDVLWTEVSKWMSNSPLLNELLKWMNTYVCVRKNEKRWFAVARAPFKPESMQGYHADNMLFIVDEASGVPEPIMEAILGTLSGDNNKLLLCGNPTRTTGTFYEAFHGDASIYRQRTVSSLDSSRTSKENIESLVRKYGKDSNVVKVRVYGEFPDQDDDVFIPLSIVERAVMTEYIPKAKPDLIHIGCDVARFGDDFTVIGFKVDEKVEFHKKVNGQDTMKTADEIVLLGNSLVRKYNLKRGVDLSIPVKVDDGGVGGGVTDRLRQMKRMNPDGLWWMDVYPVYFGQRINHKYYYDSTTYMMAIVKSLLQPFDDDGNPKPVELVLPNDNELVAQLSSRKYSLTDSSKIIIESKAEFKKRILRSPDEADCVLLLCLPVKPKKERKAVNL